MLNLNTIKEKIAEADSKSKYYIVPVEWTEELPRSEEPMIQGVAAGNLRPDPRFRLEKMYGSYYKLYQYNDYESIFESLMVIDSRML